VALERLLDALGALRLPGPTCRLAASERGRRRRPSLAVAGEAVGAKLRTERDERREVRDGLDGAGLRDPNEAVRVEVVAQQQRRVLVDGREQPRPAVVEEVALVDRLEAEGEAVLAELGEDGLTLAVVLGAERDLPEPALARGLEGDRLPEALRYNQPASSFVQ
jgi:hypothetical protein